MEFQLFISLFYFYLIIGVSNSITPNWNFSNSAQDLFSEGTSTSYTITEKIWGNSTIKLIKKLEKIDNTTTEKNYFQINNENELETNWENIESFYDIGNRYFICPTGKNYLNEYKNGELIIYKPFDIGDDWELLCYFQGNNKWMFTGYLNSMNPGKIYGFKLKDNTFSKLEIHTSILDFIWDNRPFQGNDYAMIGIIIKSSQIRLKKITITINDDDIHLNGDDEILLYDSLTYSRGYFNNLNYFFWISYNENNYVSGYSENNITSTTMNINDLILKNNTKLPFEFLNDVTIKSIDFIRNTNFVYYTIISNSNEEQTYHGVIDIKTNKVLFNTNEKIIEIKPYSKNELLIKTQLSIYKLCITGKDNNKCVDECPEGKKLILDTEKSNYCGTEEESCEKFILKPDNICIGSCNQSFYVIQNNKDCILCKDLNENKPYKIINETECLENKPENSFYINEKLGILKYCYDNCKTCTGDGENQCTSCKNGYKFIDGRCIQKQCYETCADCEIESTDEKEQNCTSCKDSNKLLQEDKGNCVDKCLDGYYEENKHCKNCYSSCLTCDKGFSDDSQHCISQINYYKKIKEIVLINV